MSRMIELSTSTKGSLGEDQDWWQLVTDSDGKMHVEHEWSHINAYKFRVGNSGKEQITINHFLSGDYNTRAQKKLRERLARRKLATLQRSGRRH
jgi:hypothetical protein